MKYIVRYQYVSWNKSAWRYVSMNEIYEIKAAHPNKSYIFETLFHARLAKRSFYPTDSDFHSEIRHV